MDSLPDPGYEHPGYVDVLVPQWIEDRGQRLHRSFDSTPSYPIELCDRERMIPIATTGVGAAPCDDRSPSKTTRKRPLRLSDEYVTRSCDVEISRHEATWIAYRQYLERCVPVKIANVELFRDTIPTHGSGSDRDDHNRMPILSPAIDSLPSPILDTAVTVQCSFLPNKSNEESNIFPSSPREIDNAISLCVNNSTANSIPMFMGQDDQITTEMSLRDAINWSSTACSMSVCVAQVPIVTTDEISNDEKSIKLGLDGRLQRSATTDIAIDNKQLHQLSSMLRLPSFLLLGDPNEISIRNINLWHAPQTCCTNVHYDDRDNLLIVAEGVKTVELCPPGCIRASAIYSEHANHPALLRRGVQNDDEDTSTDDDVRSEIETTLDLKRSRTHIISVRAGEAVYIPCGWWHRVESLPSSDERTNKGCTAVNVWFDYERRTAFPKHMVTFCLRDSARRRYDMYAERAAIFALESKRRHSMRRVGWRVPAALACSDSLRRGWELGWALLRGVESSAENDMQIFGAAFSQCWMQFIGEVKAIEVQVSAICEIVDQFRIQMENYLLLLNLGNDLHVEALVKLWTLFLPQSTESESGHLGLFSRLIFGLSPESCFVVTQAWERHRATSEVESSYRSFFGLVGDKDEKKARSYLMVGVEEFRRESCESYYMSADCVEG
jgi:hypothetical protein